MASPFRPPGGDINDDLRGLIEEGRRRRARQQATELASDILQPFSSVGTDSIVRLQQENMLREFNNSIAAERARIQPAPVEPPGTARPISGLLGTILKPFQMLQERIVEPGAGVLTEAVQRVIPGQQEIERKVAEFRAQGIGPIEARRRAFLESDLPSVRVDLTPGFSIPLPGGRKLDEVDLGVKGAIELVADPLNILLGVGVPLKALGVGGRILQKGVVPGTVQWMRAGKGAAATEAQQMARIVRRLDNEVPAPGSGVLTVPDPPKGTKYEQFLQAQEEFAIPKPTSVVGRTAARLGAAKVKIAEFTTDEFDQVSASYSRAKNEMARTGLPLDDAMNAEVHANLIKGAISAGVVKAKTVVRTSLRTLGKGIDTKHLSAYLRLRHALDVQKMHPSRLPVAPFKNPDDVDVALKDLESLIGPAQFRRIESAGKVVANGYADMLQQKVRSGLISDKLRKELRTNYPFYNPIRYVKLTEEVMDGTQEAFRTAGRAISVSSPDIHRLSEIGRAAVTEDPLETIYHAFGRSEMISRRNDAARALVQQIGLDPLSKDTLRVIRAGDKVPDGTPTISYMVAGQKRTFAVPAWAEREARQFAITDFSTLDRIGRGLNAIPRALLVNYNPAFLAANFIFDSMTVAVTKGVMPWSTLNAARKNLTAIFRNDPDFDRMIRAGGDVSGFWGRDVQDQVRIVNKGGNLGVRTESEWRTLLSRPWLLFRETAHALELAPRRAVFERAISRNRTEAQAALWARRATVDFQRGGTGIRKLNSYFLFLNPAVQGSMLPFRAAFTGDARIRALTGLGGFAAANAGVFQWNSQFPEYKDIPAFDRLGKLIVMLPSEEKDSRGNTVPHYIALVPMLREFAALTAPINHILERMQGESPETFGALMGAIFDQANPLEPISRLPVPTYIGQALTEINLNRDTFRDRPIVPLELEGLPVSQQFNEQTSDIAVRMGGWLNVSPMNIDHLLKSGLGQDIFALADMTLRDTLGEDVDAQIVAAQLKDMSDLVAPDEFRRLRNLVLADLDADLRRAVEREERRPEPDIPIATTVVNRFYRRYGGNLYRAGLERAANEGNVTVEQVRAANNMLHQLDIELQDAQIKRDAGLQDGDINGSQWRNGRRASSVMYQGALMALEIQMPPLRNFLENPAERAKFYNTVNTVSGAFADRRDKAQLLTAAFNAIPLPQIAPGIEDWDEFFSMRDSFLATLSEADRALLNAERRDGMTEEERFFDDFAAQGGLANAYWNVPEFVLGDPAVAQEFRVFETLAGELRKQVLAQRPEFLAAEQQIKLVRENMRMGSAELDAFLLRYAYTDTVLNEDNAGREFQIAPWMAGARQQFGV